jgi:hypothetical protein
VAARELSPSGFSIRLWSLFERHGCNRRDGVAHTDHPRGGEEEDQKRMKSLLIIQHETVLTAP